MNNSLQQEFSGDKALAGDAQTVTLDATGLKGVVEIRLFLDWNNTHGGAFEISDIVFSASK